MIPVFHSLWRELRAVCLLGWQRTVCPVTRGLARGSTLPAFGVISTGMAIRSAICREALAGRGGRSRKRPMGRRLG